MYSWLKAKLGGKPRAPVVPDVVPVVESEDDNPVKRAAYTTEARWKTEQLRQYLEKFAIPVKPSHVDENGVAMDESCSPGIGNAFTLSGSIIPDTVYAWYASQGFIGWQACAIISQHWLVGKACEMAGTDAVQGGWKVNRDDGEEMTPEQCKIIESLDAKYHIAKQLKEAAYFRNVFGIRLCLFIFSDFTDVDYRLPFDPDRVRPGTYKGISQIDPYWASPQLNADALKVGNRDFYVPEYWTINGKRIHKSHFVIMYGQEVPDLLKPSYIYGGKPLTQMIYERVYAAERTANEAPQLALAKRLTVRYTDLMMAMEDEATFQQAISFGSQFQDNFGTLVAGTEERIERHETSLADLDATIMTQYQLVAAIARVPATKLLGTSPKGFGASGDYEIKSYHEECRSIQRNDFTPLLDRHYQAICLSDLVKPDLKFTVAWEPLDKPSAAELAAINKQKADTDAVHQTAGAIDGYDIRKRLIEDPDSGYTGLELDDLEIEPNGEENPAIPGQAQMGGQPGQIQENPNQGNASSQPGGSGATVQPGAASPGQVDDEGRGAAG